MSADADADAAPAEGFDPETMDSRELIDTRVLVDWGNRSEIGLVSEVTDHRRRGRSLRVEVKTDYGTRMAQVPLGNEGSPDVEIVGGDE